MSLQIRLDDGYGFDTIIEGYCDTIVSDPLTGITLLEGRDHSAPLLEVRTPFNYQNQTASEIALALAKSHGLIPEITDTATTVGRYYGSDYSLVTMSKSSRILSDWDLLVALAQRERFDVFVEGSSLYFQPTSVCTELRTYIDFKDLISLRLERQPRLARGVDVTVKSWNSAQGVLVSETASAATSPMSDGSTAYVSPKYAVVTPNLDSAAARSLSQSLQTTYSSKYTSVEFTMLGETSLRPRQSICISGTNSAYDDIYRVESIRRTFRPGRGYTQSVRGMIMPATG